MFSTLIRQQPRLAFSARLSSPLHRRSLRGLPSTVQKPHVPSQRAFSISRSLFEYASNRRFGGRDSRPRFSKEPEKHSVLYVGNLPFTANETEIRELFEPYGTVKRATLASDDTGRLTGFGFIEFDSLDAAVAAVESGSEEPYVLSDRTLKVSYARNMTKWTDEPKEFPPNTTLHIANFPSPGDERPLRQLMQQYEGHILRINFMKDYEGNYTNKAFVEFSDQETATAALNAFNEYDYDGTVIKMSYARARSAPRARRQSRYDA